MQLISGVVYASPKDVNLAEFLLHLQLKPFVEVVRKKLDNAVEIMCTLTPLDKILI